MDFKDAINKIMPDVLNGSNEPFIFYRKDGDWQCDFLQNQYEDTSNWLSDIKKQDPFALLLKGSDFAKGSYPYVYDSILCSRIYEEYNIIKNSSKEPDRLNALFNFFDENISELSYTVTDYLFSSGKPFTALYELCPLILTVNNNILSYNEDLTKDAINCIENAVNERLQNYNDKPLQEKRSYYGYKEISSLQINGRCMFLGENPNAIYPYMVIEFKTDNPSGVLNSEFTGYTDDYLEALEKFKSLVEYNIIVVKSDRDVKKSLYGVEPLVLTADDCITNELNNNLKGELVIIKPEALAPECRRADFQLKLCVGDDSPLCNIILCQGLFYGHKFNINRNDILGIADMEKMPNWEMNKDERYSYTIPMQKTESKNENPSLLGKLDNNKKKIECNKTKSKNKSTPDKKKLGIAELE